MTQARKPSCWRNVCGRMHQDLHALQCNAVTLNAAAVYGQDCGAR